MKENRHTVPKWHEVPSGKVFGPTFLQKGGPPEAGDKGRGLNRQVPFDVVLIL